MEILNKVFDMWYIKVLIGAFLSIFAPIKVTILIIFLMIILDTITGTMCGYKLKQISSNSFKKSINKILIYCTSIITTRLVEYGAFPYAETFILTDIISGFLITTEGISIIENLTILGLPIPKNFLSIFIKRFRNGVLDDILEESEDDKEDLEDIINMLKYQIPNVKSDITREFIKLYAEFWMNISKDIINYMDKLTKVDNDLLYYKILSIINLSNNQFKSEIKEQAEYKKCHCSNVIFNEIKIDELLVNIKNICYNNDTINIKRQNIIKSITIFLYKVIMQVHKYEYELCNIE